MRAEREHRIGEQRRIKSSASPSKPKPRRSRSSALPVLAGLVMLCAFAGAFWQLLASEQQNSFNPPVTKVRAENQWQRINQRQLAELLQPHMGVGFFDLEVDEIKSQLESNPWIRQASVKRLWPDTLSLNLMEEVAIARWGEQSLLNQTAEVFNPPEAESLMTLPLLIGPDSSQLVVMQQYRRFRDLLFPASLHLTELTLSARGSWSMKLNDELEVVVGKEKVTERLKRFIAFYQNLTPLERLAMEAVDLRYDNGLAVRHGKEQVAELASN